MLSRLCQDAGLQSPQDEKRRKLVRPVLAAQAVKDGRALEEAAHLCLPVVREHLRLTKSFAKKMPQRLTVCMTCAGSGGDIFALDEIAKSFSKLIGIQVEFEHLWVSEIDKRKRQWLLGITGSKTCVFGDLNGLASGVAACDRHLRQCRVLRCNILISGFSCRSVSTAAYRKGRDNSACLAIGDLSASTANTFWGNTKLVQMFKFDVVLYESVDNLDAEPKNDKGDKNLQVVHDVFFDMGTVMNHNENIMINDVFRCRFIKMI